MLQDNQYTKIDDKQITDKTGKSSAEWYKLLDDYGAKVKPGKEVCRHLIDSYGLSKYWARTMYIRYQWERGLRNE